MNKKKRIYNVSRRDFLKGLGSLSVPLPLFDFMLNNNGTAYANGTALPQRMLTLKSGISPAKDHIARRSNGIYTPNHAFGTSDFEPRNTPLAESNLVDVNGNPRNLLTPQFLGRNMGRLFSAESLNNFPGLKPYISFFSNAALPWTYPPADIGNYDLNIAPGSFQGGIHHGMAGYVMATGQRSGVVRVTEYLDSQGIPRKSYRYGKVDGPTWDQILKNNLNSSSIMHVNFSMFYGVDHPAVVMQYTENGQSISPMSSTSLYFLSIFDGLQPSTGAPDPRVSYELSKRRSVLDLIDSSRMQFLNRELGSKEKAILSDHFDSIRDLEQRITDIEPPTTSACVIPEPVNNNHSYKSVPDGWTAKMNIVNEITIKGMACDRIRHGTIRLTADSTGSRFATGNISGNDADLHVLSHSNSGVSFGQMQKAYHYLTERFFSLADGLRKTQEGNQNLLDSTALMFYCGAGVGQSCEIAQPCHVHCVENLTFITAGRAGRLNSGVHVNLNKAHPSRVFLTLMRQVGYGGNSLGEISGELPEMLTS